MYSSDDAANDAFACMAGRLRFWCASWRKPRLTATEKPKGSEMLARIYRPAKNAMHSGRANARQWVLEFEPELAPKIDPLMGWTSSSDTARQVRLTFETKEEAIAFAQSRNIPHRVTEPQEPARVIKSYGENFAFGRKRPWTH